MKVFSLNLVRVKHVWSADWLSPIRPIKPISRTLRSVGNHYRWFSRTSFRKAETYARYTYLFVRIAKHDRERTCATPYSCEHGMYMLRNYMNQLKPPPCWSVGSIPRSFATLHAVHLANKDCFVVEVKNRNSIYIYIHMGRKVFFVFKKIFLQVFHLLRNFRYNYIFR